MDVKYLRRFTTLANQKREGRIGSASVCLVSQKSYPKERLAKETYAEEMEFCDTRRTAVANLWRGQAFSAHLVIHPSVDPAYNFLLSRTRRDATRCPAGVQSRSSLMGHRRGCPRTHIHLVMTWRSP